MIYLYVLFNAPAVSYTHLDVYKRQAPYRCGRNRGSRAIHQYTGPTVMGAHRFDIIEIKKAFDDLHFAQQIVFFSL